MSSALPPLLGERVARVVVRHREEIDPGPRFGRSSVTLLPGPLRHPLRDARQRFRARTGKITSSGTGTDGLILVAAFERGPVMLRQEGGDDLLVRDLRLLDRVRRRRPPACPRERTGARSPRGPPRGRSRRRRGPRRRPSPRAAPRAPSRSREAGRGTRRPARTASRVLRPASSRRARATARRAGPSRNFATASTCSAYQRGSTS